MAQEHMLQSVMIMISDKPRRHLIVEVPLFAHHTILEHLGISATQQHLPVIVALNHQVVGLSHIVGGPLCNDTHISRHDKALALKFDTESHTLDIVQRLKCGNLHIHYAERYLLENRHMVITNATADAAALQHLSHNAHRTIDTTMASTHSRIQATHVILMGVGEQDALDHVAAHTVALQFDKGLVQRGNILTLGILFLAVILNGFPNTSINEDATTRGPQVGTIPTTATTQAHKAQALTPV